MTYPEILFTDIRKGDTIREVVNGGSMTRQGVVDQQIARNTWDTPDGYTVAYDDHRRTFLLIDRPKEPDTPEPKNIGAVVEVAEGHMMVRVKTASARDTYVWYMSSSGVHLAWSELSQPVTVKNEGWAQ